LLKTEGYEIETANSPAVILSLLEAKNFDLALIDLNYTRDTTSGQEGLDLLSRLQAVDGTFPVVVMTAWGSLELVVDAMRRRARDFIQKPWDNARLLAICAHSDRAESGASQGPAPGSGKPAVA